MAIALGEDGWEAMRHAIAASQPIIPAPVLTELQMVITSRAPQIAAVANNLILTLLVDGGRVASFEHRHADMTATARERYGKGNGASGMLNFGDLMVYAIAKDRGQPLLCTGLDFASTDLVMHPASRLSA